MLTAQEISGRNEMSMKKFRFKSGHHYFSRNAGAVIVESAISLSLFLLVVLGFVHLYSVMFEKMKHAQIATEMMMGPQERSLIFDKDAGTFGQFEMLDDTTSPTLQEFMDEIGNFFLSRNLSTGVLHIRLVHIPIDDETGLPTSNNIAVGADDQIFTYAENPQSPCNSADIRNRLQSESASRAAAMASYRNPVNNSQPVIGTKLYDVVTGAERYQGYIDYIPIAYITICSEPYNYLFPQLALSTYELIPRRLVN